MRKYQVIFLLCLCCLASCHKDSGPADAPSIQPDNRLDTLVTFNAILNKVSWQTDSVFASYVTYPSDSNAENIQINAYGKQNDTSLSFVFNLTNFSGPGLYYINPPTNAFTCYKGSQRYYAVNGLITILSDSAHSLIGKYYFTSADSICYGSGTFNVAMP